jgi:hypothetical protein
MTIKQFIERAIEGGWEEGKALKNTVKQYEEIGLPLMAEAIPELMFLDPLAWQAVGKVEGWEKTDYCWGCGYDEGATCDTPIWKVKMHNMIDALIEGKSVSEYIETL